ncbi:MAG: hypothetical protein ACOH2A_03915 [Sphingobacteriaceae bacterium]
MSDPLDFKYDTITVFHVEDVQFGKPALSIEQKLDSVISKTLPDANYKDFEQWADTQKYPILSSVELQNGVYAAKLFKLFADPLKSFGKDLSHYQYLKLNQSQPDNSYSQEAGTPFDEKVAIPTQNAKCDPESEHLTALFKTKFTQLEKFMCHMLMADGITHEKNIGNDLRTTATSFLKRNAN